jgi:RNA polymerase sigma-70 factor (ECF subfamily)
MKVVVAVGQPPVVSPAAFAEFYDHAAPEVFRYLARSVLGNRAVAEDLTQETFAAVVVAVRDGRPESLTMAWVMGIARHKLLDHYRRLARDERHLALAWADSADCVELDQFASADPDRVLELLRSLRAEHQLVLILKYVDDLPGQEIANALNRSLDATNSLLSRARRALAESLTENSS